MVAKSKYLHLKIAQIWVIACLLAACTQSGTIQATWTARVTATLPHTPSTLPAPQIKVTALPTATANPSPTNPPPTPTISPTPDPFEVYSIESLSGRGYGGGELKVEEVLVVNSYFTRTLVAYPSDGLTIYGFMNTPKLPIAPKMPVVIALHGYIDPGIYATLDYTTHYADALAQAGFLVIHPNLRGYAPSDDGDNLFRVGMAIDVLNLIALVKENAGKPGALEYADPQAIGIWGHSMGGGISTRVITVSPDVRAAVLYGAMSGDDRQNYERILHYFSNGTRGQEELNAPERAFLQISPIYYLERIQAAVSIHHGENDPDVPLDWSIDLCRRLKDLGKTVECFIYEGQPHTFHGDGDNLFIERTIAFFKKQLAVNSSQ